MACTQVFSIFQRVARFFQIQFGVMTPPSLMKDGSSEENANLDFSKILISTLRVLGNVNDNNHLFSHSMCDTNVEMMIQMSPFSRVITPVTTESIYYFSSTLDIQAGIVGFVSTRCKDDTSTALNLSIQKTYEDKLRMGSL